MGECLIVRKGSQPEGTATPSQVLSGATFQSANSDDLQTGTLSLTGNASANDVLNGKTFYNTNAQSKLTGTMTNNGNVSVTLSTGDSYTIPQGYHGGSGKVTANIASATLLASGSGESNSAVTMCTTSKYWGAVLAVVVNSDTSNATSGTTITCSGGTKIIDVSKQKNYQSSTNAKGHAYVSFALYANVPSKSTLSFSGGGWSRVWNVYAF